jgi:hypothetical protein
MLIHDRGSKGVVDQVPVQSVQLEHPSQFLQFVLLLLPPLISLIDDLRDPETFAID